MSKIIFISFIVYYLMQNLSATSLKSTTEAPKRCTINFRCSPHFRNLTWTIGEGVCRPIQNGCNLAQEDCARVNRGQEHLQVTEKKEDCLKHRPQTCTKIYRPVNAEFPYKTAEGKDDIETLRFSNLCMLQQYSCDNERAYIKWEDEWRHSKPKSGKRRGSCRRARKH